MITQRLNRIVGARYIPLYMGEHDPNREYEALSVVTKEGNSYTSRQPVPIGIDVTNTTYWYISGNFNSQLSRVLSQIQNLTDRLNNLLFINVQDYGAVGDGVTDDTNAFKSAFANTDNKIIFIPYGNYLISKSVRVNSNTMVLAYNSTVKGNGVIPFTFVDLNTNVETGYNGTHDVKWYGGTIDMLGNQKDAMCLMHCQNMFFKDIVYTNNKDEHYVELNSTQNCIFDSCIFQSMTHTTTNHECINIDRACSNGFPIAGGGYDDTCCDNIKIVNCTFRNVESGVGNHGTGLNGNGVLFKHTNTILEGCTFINVDYGVRFYSHEVATISNCIFDNCKRAIDMFSTSKLNVNNNSIVNSECGIRCTAWNSGGNNYPSHDINVSGNMLDTLSDVGYNFQYVTNLMFTGNTAKNVDGMGFYGKELYDSVISNNNFKDIALTNESPIYIELSQRVEIFNNKVNLGVSKAYIFRVKATCSDIQLSKNRAYGYTTSLYECNMKLNYIDGKKIIYSGTSTSGEVSLTDGYTKYAKLLIQTGSASSMGLMTSIVYPYMARQQFVDDDSVCCHTQSGILKGDFTSETSFLITQADDPLRYIVGCLW